MNVAPQGQANQPVLTSPQIQSTVVIATSWNGLYPIASLYGFPKQPRATGSSKGWDPACLAHYRLAKFSRMSEWHECIREL